VLDAIRGATNAAELKSALGRISGELACVLVECALNPKAQLNSRVSSATRLLEFAGLTPPKRANPETPKRKTDYGATAKLSAKDRQELRAKMGLTDDDA
jgi:hypothetical protein